MSHLHYVPTRRELAITIRNYNSRLGELLRQLADCDSALDVVRDDRTYDTYNANIKHLVNKLGVVLTDTENAIHDAKWLSDTIKTNGGVHDEY